jgi:hypothetical protein
MLMLQLYTNASTDPAHHNSNVSVIHNTFCILFKSTDSSKHSLIRLDSHIQSNKMSTLTTCLAATRVSLGAFATIAPLLTCSVFHLPAPASAAMLVRFFSSRELAFGCLLWAARRATTTPSPTTGQKQTATTPSASNFRALLLASVAVDSLDAMGAIWCYAQGSLGAEATAWTAIGAVLAAGWGGLCLSRA